MKAMRVHEYGGPEVMTYEEIPDPRPAAGEVLVDMKVIGVNYSDTHHRSGSSRIHEPPIIPGHEGAGVITELGEGVTSLKVGERVAFAGQHRLGTYKQKMVVAVPSAIPVPATIDLKLAVAVLNQAQTAHYLAHEAHPIQRGERVLIHAGAGGVGSNLVQMAKRLGAEIFTTVSSEEKAAFARDLGADRVCLYTQVDFVKEVMDWTDGKGVDAGFDAIGGDILLQSLHCLKRKGHLVTYGQSAGAAPPLQWPVAGIGSYYLSQHTGADYSAPGEATIRRAHEIFRWVREGELKVHVHKEYPLTEAAQAHRDIESRGTIGKLLLIP